MLPGLSHGWEGNMWNFNRALPVGVTSLQRNSLGLDYIKTTERIPLGEGQDPSAYSLHCVSFAFAL